MTRKIRAFFHNGNQWDAGRFSSGRPVAISRATPSSSTSCCILLCSTRRASSEPRASRQACTSVFPALHRLVEGRDQLLQLGQLGLERLQLRARDGKAGQDLPHLGMCLGHAGGILVEQLLARRRGDCDLALVAVEERQVNAHARSCGS